MFQSDVALSVVPPIQKTVSTTVGLLQKSEHARTATLRTILALFVCAAFHLPASVSAQDFDPRSYQSKLAGEPTQVMVLGTAHLSSAPETWDPSVLEPLLERLAAFNPDIIATEDQSGPSLYKLWSYRESSPNTATRYGGRALRMAAEAGLTLDLEMPEADAALRKALTSLAQEPTAADRRRLVALFSAAGYAHSALVQWWRLPESERVAKDGLSTRLISLLDELGSSRNESVAIAAKLASRLGLDRIYPMDAQDEDVFTDRESDIFGKTVFPGIMEQYRAEPLLQDAGDVARMTDGATTLAEYRKLNDPRKNLRRSDIEWLGALDQMTEAKVGRKRVAGWEVRNLRMASNIREAAARAPGGKVLVIVGAAHKIWIEAYLRSMTDVRVVSTDTVLDR